MALDGMERLRERHALVQADEPVAALALAAERRRDIHRPRHLATGHRDARLPSHRDVERGQRRRRARSATPASPTTQAATTLDTTTSDPNRFTTCSSRLSRGKPGRPRRKAARPDHRRRVRCASAPHRPTSSGPGRVSTPNNNNPCRKLRRRAHPKPRWESGRSVPIGQERERRRGCELLLRSAPQAEVSQRRAIGTLLGRKAAVSSGTDRVVLTTR